MEDPVRGAPSSQTLDIPPRNNTDATHAKGLSYPANDALAQVKSRRYHRNVRTIHNLYRKESSPALRPILSQNNV
jgi:hypothetical protein